MKNEAKEWGNKLGAGMVPIGAKDKNGRELHQYEALYCEGYNSVIIWSMFNENFVAYNDEGGWLDKEAMQHGEHVLFNGEEHWDDVNEVISDLDEKQAEAVVRLVTSHFNFDAMFNEAIRALEKISEETNDEQTKAYASEKVAFLCSLIKPQIQGS